MKFAELCWKKYRGAYLHILFPGLQLQTPSCLTCLFHTKAWNTRTSLHEIFLRKSNLCHVQYIYIWQREFTKNTGPRFIVYSYHKWIWWFWDRICLISSECRVEQIPNPANDLLHVHLSVEMYEKGKKVFFENSLIIEWHAYFFMMELHSFTICYSRSAIHEWNALNPGLTYACGKKKLGSRLWNYSIWARSESIYDNASVTLWNDVRTQGPKAKSREMMLAII